MKKKKSHSFLGNTAFMFRLLHRLDRALLPSKFAYCVFCVIFELGVAGFATSLTYCLENGKGLPVILLVTLGVAVIQIVASTLMNILYQSVECKNDKIKRNYDVLLCQKVMNMDFDLFEGPVGREKYQKAKNALNDKGIYMFLDQFGKLIVSLLLIATYGTVTAALNPWLILILVALEALKLAFAALESRLVAKTKDPLAKIDRRLTYVNRVSRDFAIAKDVRLYRLRNRLLEMSKYFIGERLFWTKKMYFNYFLTDLMSLVLSVGIEIGIFVYIIYSMLHGNISKTELVMYVCTVMEFCAYIEYIGGVIIRNIELNVEIGNFREFLDIENQMKNTGGIPLPSKMPYQIELENVSFTYPESDKQVLKNINLQLKPGENLALVGVNGAGKTTLVKIICGLYRPTSGRVLINGIDISEFNRDDYYKAISAVFQDPRVLPCTVLENVSMLPADESDRERFFDCVKRAGFYNKIQALPQKENTLLVKTVNENAVELSGGEMQRLLLARALYKDAPILILDEPTAALDPIAEYEIYSRFNEMVKNKTAVYISHRLSSCRFCDKIAVFHGGEMIQFGSHDDLLADTEGKYYELWNAQAKYYDKKNDAAKFDANILPCKDNS